MSVLQGKRVVITGSSRGLGRAVAIEMAKAGAQVVVNGTNAEALAETAALIAKAGGEAVGVVGSVADSGVCATLVKTCVDLFGGIDVLINNAGQVRDRTLLKMSDEDFDEVIAVHLRGAFMCGKHAALAMKEQGGGHIINVTSSSGLSGGFGQSNYAAAKAGMLGLMRTWVMELSRANIRCNSFWPIAATEMTQRMTTGILQANGQTMIEPTMDVQVVADSVVYMAGLPLSANVLFHTVMATNMPFVGRG
jgi:NAD(P)-dependent dehydrogenase (short-subunit alcohol dehydrogenase family)